MDDASDVGLHAGLGTPAAAAPAPGPVPVYGAAPAPPASAAPSTARVWLYILVTLLVLLVAYVVVGYTRDVRNREFQRDRVHLVEYVNHAKTAAHRLPHGHATHRGQVAHHHRYRRDWVSEEDADDAERASEAPESPSEASEPDRVK